MMIAQVYMDATINKIITDFTIMSALMNKFISEKIIFPPKLIKIDVDGNEMEILNGCKNLLEKSKKISILIETRPQTEKMVEQKLSGYGFMKISSLKYNSVWEN